jgi:hypothetical protein
VTLIERTDKDYDEVYFNDPEGCTNPVILKDQSIMPQLMKPDLDIKKISDHLPNFEACTDNRTDAINLFHAMANNTGVEWHLQGFKCSNGSRTFKLNSNHARSSVFAGTAPFSEASLLFDIHNHPRGSVNYPKQLGYSTNPVGGDALMLGWRSDRLSSQGLPTPPHYMYQPACNTLLEYRYTATSPIIFISTSVSSGSEGSSFLRSILPR